MHTATVVHTKQRTATLRDQCVHASSMLNSTPPMGAPNAACPRQSPALAKIPPPLSGYSCGHQKPWDTGRGYGKANLMHTVKQKTSNSIEITQRTLLANMEID